SASELMAQSGGLSDAGLKQAIRFDDPSADCGWCSSGDRGGGEQGGLGRRLGRLHSAHLRPRRVGHRLRLRLRVGLRLWHLFWRSLLREHAAKVAHAAIRQDLGQKTLRPLRFFLYFLHLLWRLRWKRGLCWRRWVLGSGVCWYGSSSVPSCPRMLRRDVVEPDARSCGTGGDQREPVLPDPHDGVTLLRQVVAVHTVASSACTLVQEVEQPLAKTSKPSKACTHQRGSTDGVWHTANICVLVGQRALPPSAPQVRSGWWK
ncbi:MAG: hypothetical protein SGPRY_009788, partial [Prymnesium sp.]